jgi:GNAT superfamily N-acetyltransferase
MMSSTITSRPVEMKYSIREYRPEDESAVLSLIQHGMGGGPTGERDVQFWRWKHFDNPFGRSIALVAVDHADQIIGLRTFMRWRFQAGDRTISAVRAVDTVTHSEYRRYGVFSELTRAAVQQVKASGVDLIFNTPNNQVLPGYLKLGWTYVAQVRPLVKVLNYPRFIAGMLRSRGRSRASAQVPLEEIFRGRAMPVAEYLDSSKSIGRLTDLQQVAANGRLATSRSLEYLRWRYAQYPNLKYGVVCREENGVAPVCAILRSSRRFGLKEAVIAEMLVPGPEIKTASVLLDDLKRRIAADYLIAYFPEGSFKRRLLLKHGFHQVPRAGQNFTVNVLSSNLPCDPRLLKSWDISLGDLEVF